MTLTIDAVRTWFGQFNADYFGGELPVPRFRLTKARTRLGTMACRRVLRLSGWRYTDFCISLSTYYDCTEREYQTTLLHEMIHLSIASRHIRDTSAHGRVFREMMNRLNRDHGWHITISSSMRAHRVADPSAQTAASYLVLAIVLDDGQRMLSVVSPRSARRIDAMARSTVRIADHRWYMSHDLYFAAFPRVRSLRARRVDTQLFDAKTATMQPLTLRGGQ